MSQSIIKKIIKNKKAYYEYFIEKQIESGIELLGWEVKAVRSRMISINNSYVAFNKQEAYIYNSVFQCHNKTTFSDNIYNTTRSRKLLLNKYELLFLKEKTNQYHYTIIVLDLYWKNSWIKAHIGLAKGKNQYDKRNKIHTQTWKHEKNKLKKYVNK